MLEIPMSNRPAQVPGKPKICRPLMSEMENRLAMRRDKVDAEAYVSEGPDPVAPPPEPACLPPSGAHRKPSTASVDSGRGSLEPGLTSRSSLEPGGYARVTVDQERKEELMLAKAVRRSSAKMLGRDPSPSQCSESPETVKEATPGPGSVEPASQVVLRYWQQCSSTADSGYFGEEGISMEDVAKGSATANLWVTGNVAPFLLVRIIFTCPALLGRHVTADRAIGNLRSSKCIITCVTHLLKPRPQTVMGTWCRPGAQRRSRGRSRTSPALRPR
jgi:hypothetical protein